MFHSSAKTYDGTCKKPAPYLLFIMSVEKDKPSSLNDDDNKLPFIYYLGKNDDPTGPHLIIDWTAHKHGPSYQSIECLYAALKQPLSSEQEPTYLVSDEERESFAKLQALVAADTSSKQKPKFAMRTTKGNDDIPRFGLLTVPPMLDLLLGKMYRGEIIPDPRPESETNNVEQQKPNGKPHIKKQTKTKKTNAKASKARKCKTKLES